MTLTQLTIQCWYTSIFSNGFKNYNIHTCGWRKTKKEKNTAQKAGNLLIILYYLTFKILRHEIGIY